MARIADVDDKVRQLLWAKSCGRCQYEPCNELLYEDHLTKIEDNFANVAHIIGASVNGPRGDPKRSIDVAYCNNIENLMLLCPNHHKMIDTDPDRFPESTLRALKKSQENRIRQQTEIKPENSSNVIIYRGNIGGYQPSITYNDAKTAMFPDYYPAQGQAIELGMQNSSLYDDESNFWEIEEGNLIKQFNLKVNPIVSSVRTANHFSIFGFAPIPLLIKLGALLPDLIPAEIYQLKKDPANWAWEEKPHSFEFVTFKPQGRSKTVALNLSISADIDDQRIYKVLGEDTEIWKITTTSKDFPKNDSFRSRAQIIEFSKLIRILLNEIKLNHDDQTLLHIFPSIPVSAALVLGRVRQSKADMPYLIYDQNYKLNGFSKTLLIQ